ncbi:MAG: MaoC family dehydratase N-terminal domain-containing protein [Mycobacteriaceae bacterium]
MVVNEKFLRGAHPATAPYVVGREKIREFASAVGATDAIHHDLTAARGQGYTDLVAPPTFAIVLTLKAEQDVVTHPGAGVDWGRVVHREQRFTHHRPVVAGDELTAQVFLADVREVAGNDLVSCRTEVQDGVGEPVLTALSTLVVRAPDTEPAP